MIPVTVVILVLSALACFYRVLVGPTVPDRLVAADTIGLLLALVMVLLAHHYALNPLYDVALVYAVLQFADVLIVAKYIEREEFHL